MIMLRRSEDSELLCASDFCKSPVPALGSSQACSFNKAKIAQPWSAMDHVGHKINALSHEKSHVWDSLSRLSYDDT